MASAILDTNLNASLRDALANTSVLNHLPPLPRPGLPSGRLLATPSGLVEIASHLFVPNWNPRDIVLSNEEPICDALETVLTAKRKNLSDNQKAAILNEILGATNGLETVGALRDLDEEKWKEIRGIPVICRIYLKHLVGHSVNLSFREVLECDFNRGLAMDWDEYSSNLAVLIPCGFSENECLEALVLCNNSVPSAMEHLLLSHAKRRSYRERVKNDRKVCVEPGKHWTVIRRMEEQKANDSEYAWSRMSSDELRGELSRHRDQIQSEHEINRDLCLQLGAMLIDRKLRLYAEFLKGLTASGDLSMREVQQMQAYRDEKMIADDEHDKVLQELGLSTDDLDVMKNGATTSSAGSTDGSGLEVVCLICADMPRDHVVLPCGHVCFCDECADLYDVDANPDGECPICRGPVGEVKKIYF